MSADRPRRSAARDQMKAPLAYYRSGERSDVSPFEKPKRPKRRRYISKIVDFLLIIAVLAAVAYSLIIRPDPRINLNTSFYHSADVYRQAALSSFRSFKNQNKITINEGAIVESLGKQFPEVASASVDVPLFSPRPTLRLNIAEPAFVLNNQGLNYLIDSEGVAVAETSELQHVRALPTVIDQSDFSVKRGQRVLSASNVNFINILLAQTKHARVPIASITLPATPQELDLRTKDQIYYAKFYLNGDPLVESGQFLAARQHFTAVKKYPKQYLDVRVAGKVYYK